MNAHVKHSAVRSRSGHSGVTAANPCGADHFMSDREKLELLLSSAVPGGDAGKTAGSMLGAFHTLGGIFAAPADSLEDLKFSNERAAALMLLVKSIGEDCLKERLTGRNITECTLDIIRYFRFTLGWLGKERFMTVFLDGRDNITGLETLASGTVDKLFVHPRELIERALRKKASGMILAHNHPGGSVMPSEADIRLTGAMCGIASDMRLEIVDHVIVAKTGAYSILSGRGIEFSGGDFRFGSPHSAAGCRPRTGFVPPFSTKRLAVRNFSTLIENNMEDMK